MQVRILLLVLGSWFLGLVGVSGCADSAEEPAPPASSETRQAELEETEDESAFDFAALREAAESERSRKAIDGCAEGSAKACYELGDMLHGGDDIVRDNELSVAIIDHACQQGYMRACYDMGVRYHLGVEVDQNLHAGRAYFQHACQQGVAESCHMLARIARDGTGVPVDPALAERYAQRSCSLGFVPDCEATWPTTLVAGEQESALPADASDEVAEMARICDSGLMSGCVDLARAYQSGEGVSPDWERAYALYGSACDWGHLGACEVWRARE